MPLRTDRLIIPQGTSWEAQWPVQNEDGSVADLTGWTPRAQARTRVSSREVLHEWTSALGNINIVDNIVSMTVLPITSSTWDWREAVFDVELYHTDGRVVRISQGEIKVDPEVTR